MTSEGEMVWDYLHNETGQNSISKAFKYPIDYFQSGEFLFGDINYDRNLDIFDVILVVNSILNINELDLSQLYVADLNADGDISVDDIILLINLILD